MKKQLDLRERVYRYYSQHKSKGKMFTINHFLTEQEHARTIRRIIDRFYNGIITNKRKGGGRIAKKMPSKKVSQLKKIFDHKNGISQRQAAAKFQVTQAYICQLLKNKSDIVCRKRIKIPARSEQQITEAKTKSATMVRKYKDFDFIIDDESYFTLSHSSINGNSNYYSSDVNLTPASVKYSLKAKY